MKLTVLVDNNVCFCKKGCGQHGFSVYIEEDDKKILFDTGESDVFLKNAEIYGIYLSKLTTFVLSHGHYDHSWGIPCLVDFLQNKKIDFIAHPNIMLPKLIENCDIGISVSEKYLHDNFNVRFSKTPLQITDKLFFLGEIPRLDDFECKRQFVASDGNEYKDCILDDTALVYNSEDGLVIITGCAHSGICNTISYAKSVTGNDKIKTIIGGWHLIQESDAYLEHIGKLLVDNKIESIYPCHCTGLQAKIYLSKFSDVKDVGVGLSMDI
ncbi:MAG: MBL fold metallo-hydrolase [Alphaproteobacteria bacterium]|nr:MBL fold metallo-hydrolase [Alphaproteobacteria bacterium]